MSGTTRSPVAVRKLDTPAARVLADLAAIFDELQIVLRCCERLVAELSDEHDRPDTELVTEALWTTAVLSYCRCFVAGRRATALTEQDVHELPLQGEVLEWHKVLRQLRKHYADPAENPRERFSVGAAQDGRGRANGIAVTSTRLPGVDDQTVRQTGALAYQLSQLVDRRITEEQQRVSAAADELSPDELASLPQIEVAKP